MTWRASCARSSILAYAKWAGYVGYIVLGDPETGKALGVTLWESAEAREASDATARQIRPRVEQETGGTMRAVERFDVLFFDVRAQ
jgi:hypothetical protein